MTGRAVVVEAVRNVVGIGGAVELGAMARKTERRSICETALMATHASDGRMRTGQRKAGEFVIVTARIGGDPSGCRMALIAFKRECV